MMNYDPLRQELIDIATVLKPHDINLIVGGGYGLYLKTQHVIETQSLTRFAEEPYARSTEDLDFFLRTEIICDPERMKQIRDSIKELGYTVRAEYFQFERTIDLSGSAHTVKIDLLAPRPKSDEELKKVKISKPRIRPHNADKIHAYLTEEAITIDIGLLPISISRDDSQLQVFIPHPFSYLLLKLFALRDHIEKEDRSKAPEHAADIYRIIGMMTQDEWELALKLSKEFANDPICQEASVIVGDLYSGMDSSGSIETFRLLGRSESVQSNLQMLISDLKTLFPPFLTSALESPNKDV